ncbi:MAG: helix-turn-helix domain-containing protein [Bryobacteraceae bacterium]
MSPATPAGKRTVPPAFMTSKEVAHLVRMHRDTILRMAKQGRIPGAHKFGRHWRFSTGQILRWFGGSIVPGGPAL